MSSHHFVKEGQEPALLLIDPPAIEVAGPLLEWAPLVVVEQAAIEKVSSWNIKIDVVLAKESSVTELASKLLNQAPIKILAYGPNESPLVNALHFLTRSRQRAVNIFSSHPDTFALVKNFTDQLQINVMDGWSKWSAIAAGSFEKWMVSNTPVFLKTSASDQAILQEGLKHVDDHHESISDGLIRLRSEALFWVGEPYVSET
jgi:hypothetical protein